MDVSDGSATPPQMNEIKSKILSISGLTSNVSNNNSNEFDGSSSANNPNKNLKNNFHTVNGRNV